MVVRDGTVLSASDVRAGTMTGTYDDMNIIKRSGEEMEFERGKIAAAIRKANATVEDADKLTEGIKADWADFVVNTVKKGVNNAKPPKSDGGGTMTKEEIMAIKDTAQRQAAIAENHELFGI